MSTEYYHAEICDCTCPNCPGGRARYLGHSAAGWKFAWQEYDDVKTIEQAAEVYSQGHIVDECGRLHPWDELVRLDGVKIGGRWYRGDTYGKADRIDSDGHRWIQWTPDDAPVYVIAYVRRALGLEVRGD